jgi:hypothetical protein
MKDSTTIRKHAGPEKKPVMGSRRQLEGRRRSEERRRRHDDAPRLSAVVPRLSGLGFEIANGDAKYRWPILVDRAPALFEVACDDHDCQEGGHDLTLAIMRSLRAGSVRLEGEDVCAGRRRGGECGHVLRYLGVAAYRA